MFLTSEEQMEKYLAVIKEVHQSCTTYDIHIHPFEVFFNPLDYKEDPHRKGLFSLGNIKYSKPTLQSLKSALSKEEPSSLPDTRSLKFFLRRSYLHTGPFVFRSLLGIAKIDKGLLLPVGRGNADFEKQMTLMFRMYSGDKRFCIAGSIPDFIKNEEIQGFLKTQIDQYAIVAVKIHPNLSGIDLNEATGQGRLESIIGACSNLALPLIIHAGRSNHLTGSASRFAEIANFKLLNLKTSAPIVIAHGGAYGIPADEIHEVVIPVLRELLDTNENLCIDISGLSFETIRQLLINIDIDKILFGSDALYYNPFAMEIRLLDALESVHLKIEESYMRIISQNIEQRAFHWK